MNFGQEFLAKDELELSIVGLLKTCLKHIKWIVIVAVLMAVLLAGYMYTKSGSITTVGEELSKEQQTAVDNYLVLYEKMQQCQAYTEESPIMNMNCNYVYSITAQYYVQAEEWMQKNIATALVSYINSKECADLFCQKAGVESTAYVQEYYIASLEEESDGVLRLIVRTSVEENTARYMEVLKELISQKQKSLTEVIGPNDLVLLQESVENGYCSDVYDVQNKFYTDMTTIKKNMTTLSNSMSDAQKLAVMEASDAQLALIDGQPNALKDMIKYAVLGFAVGAVLGVMFVVLGTLFNGKLQSDRELAKRLQVAHLGTLNDTQDGVIMTAVRIMKLLESQGKKQVHFVSTEGVISNDNICKVCDLLSEKQIQTKILGDITMEQSALTELASETPVILIETIGKSVVSKVYQQAELCRDMNVAIMGYIAMENNK